MPHLTLKIKISDPGYYAADQVTGIMSQMATATKMTQDISIRSIGMNKPTTDTRDPTAVPWICW